MTTLLLQLLLVSVLVGAFVTAGAMVYFDTMRRSYGGEEDEHQHR